MKKMIVSIHTKYHQTDGYQLIKNKIWRTDIKINSFNFGHPQIVALLQLEQSLLQHLSRFLFLVIFFPCFVELLESSNIMQCHLAINLIPNLFIVLYLRSKCTILHLRVLDLLLIMLLFLLYLLFYNVEAFRPLGLRHQSTHLIYRGTVSGSLFLFNLAYVMFLTSPLYLPRYIVNFRIETTLSIDLCLYLANMVSFLDSWCLDHAIVLLLACLVGSVLHHERGQRVNRGCKQVLGSICTIFVYFWLLCWQVVINYWRKCTLFFEIYLHVFPQDVDPILSLHEILNQSINNILYNSLLLNKHFRCLIDLRLERKMDLFLLSDHFSILFLLFQNFLQSFIEWFEVKPFRIQNFPFRSIIFLILECLHFQSFLLKLLLFSLELFLSFHLSLLVQFCMYVFFILLSVV